jgi:predicted transcriptional regulator
MRGDSNFTQASAASPGQPVADGSGPQESGPSATSGPTYRTWTVSQLAELPKPEYLVDGWIVADGLNGYYGPAGGGKTFIALGMAFSIATGQDWLGNSTTAGAVVYVAAEGRRGIAQRAKAWGAENGVDDLDRVQFITEVVNLMDPESVAKVRHTIDALPEPPVLIVFDTLARTMVGGDENSARDMGMYLANVDAIRGDTNAAALVIHHTGKAGTEERGSSALRGAADLMAVVKPDGLNLTLECNKNKDDAEADTLDLHLAEVRESLSLRLGSNRSGLSPNERAVLQSLTEAFGSDPAPASKLQAACEIPERSYYRAVQTLLQRGYLEQRPQGRSKLYSLTSRGSTALLPTTAKDCQAPDPITAANATPLGVAVGSTDGSNDGQGAQSQRQSNDPDTRESSDGGGRNV